MTFVVDTNNNNYVIAILTLITFPHIVHSFTTYLTHRTLTYPQAGSYQFLVGMAHALAVRVT